MQVMIIAGEASGDLHGSGVVRELRRLRPDCAVYGIGGDRMQAAGMNLVYHVRELSFMGFFEVVQHLPLIRSVERTLEALVKARRPDVLLLIDYPGFNLRFAKKARALGIKIIYYISPQVWAWNPGRVRTMKGVIDKMLVVFPFEEEIYRKAGIDAAFVGHPLLEVLEPPQEKPEFCKRWGLRPDVPILALLPGSREQEIERILPGMLGAARLLHRSAGVQTVVGVAPGIEPERIASYVRGDVPVTIVQHATYDLMKNADVAIVTSGTATLETGFYRTPMVVVYRTSWITYAIGRLLVRIKNIGLVNIVAGRQIVPELLQGAATPQRLAEAAGALLASPERRSAMAGDLAVIAERLGTKGASLRVAQTIVSMA
jgi:lipid-A-disaccharide synthase